MPARAIDVANPKALSPARANEQAKAKAEPPARATVAATPIRATPARAKVVAKPKGTPPARAITNPTTKPQSPARAKHDPNPKAVPPARAMEQAKAKADPPARARATAIPTPHPPARATVRPTSNVHAPARATEAAIPTLHPPARADLDTIRTLGALLDDLEKVRIMNSNRIGTLEREHGESLPHLDVIQKQVAVAEHLAHLELVRAWRRHPLAPWARGYRGLGEKSIGRLIASVGDPADRENVAKLWAYCGHGNPARKRKRGMTQEEAFKLGNPRAKKQVWLIATSMLKAGNRVVYDSRRVQTADRLHEASCVRCGPAGKPALPGSAWSDGHKHADALRVMGKAFLLDLWLASRHQQADDHERSAGGES